MLFSTLRFITLGWVHEQYIQPSYHFPYYGFEFVRAYSPEFIYCLFGLLLVSTIGIILGLFYRFHCILFFLTFTYIELIDKTYYLNHYYFISVMSFILCFLPAHAQYSLDARRIGSLAVEYVPRYTVHIVQGMISIVYIYAGIAKINEEWLFHAMPLSLWLPAQDAFPIIGFLFKERVTAYIFSWAGMIFDCTIPIFLFMRTTRLYAFIIAACFHALTGYFFQIGVFPLVMTFCLLIFFDSSFHTKCLSVFSTLFRPSLCEVGTVYHCNTMLPSILAVIFCTQLLIPWRYLFYEGNRFWTEQGYRFGWRVMLMEKSGSATFYVQDAVTGKEGVVVNSEFLNRHQEKQMSMQPDMIVQFAHYIAEFYSKKGIRVGSVRAEVYATLNGRPSRLLIDSHVNLLQYSDDFSEKKWIHHYND